LVTVSVAIPLAALARAWGATDPHGLRSAAFGAGLAGVNAIAAYAIAIWSRGRSTNVFMGAVLGGMVGRMGLMLAAVAAGLGLLDLRRLPLVTALLTYFVIFLAVELMVLNRRPAEAA
jgi:hypothetical protein